jgi:hypothetical protein
MEAVAVVAVTEVSDMDNPESSRRAVGTVVEAAGRH